MPLLTRLYLRTALIYLTIGATFGGLILWGKGSGGSAASWWTLLAAHVSLMTWGWLLLLTLGVAYWILPRSGTERPHSWLVVIAYICLNAALLIAAAAAWLSVAWTSSIAGLLQLLAALAFALHAWPRVRPSTYGK
jgi:hypothetical protein